MGYKFEYPEMCCTFCILHIFLQLVVGYEMICRMRLLRDITLPLRLGKMCRIVEEISADEEITAWTEVASRVRDNSLLNHHKFSNRSNYYPNPLFNYVPPR
jgi:hypothetical protein